MNFKNPIWLAIFAATLVLAACKNNAENSGEGAAAPAAEAAAEGGEAVAEVAAEGEAAVEAAGEAVEEAVGEVAGTGAAAPAAGEVAAAPTPVEVDPNFVATAESLHGTWAADFQSLLSGGDMSAEERAMMQAMLANATMEFTFTADGTLALDGTVMGQTQSESGTWAFVSAEGNTVNLSMTMATAEGAEPETKTMKAVFSSANHMVLSDDAGEEVPFNRKP